MYFVIIDKCLLLICHPFTILSSLHLKKLFLFYIQWGIGLILKLIN